MKSDFRFSYNLMLELPQNKKLSDYDGEYDTLIVYSVNTHIFSITIMR